MVYLPGLVQGLTSAVGGALEGQNRRRTLEQQAMQQALHERMAQELAQAQIAHLNAETQHLQQPTARAPVVGSPEWVAAQGAAARARALATAGVKADTPLTPAERRAAAQVVRSLREMRSLYQRDKTSAQTPVSSAILGGIGHMADKVGLGGLVNPAAQRALTQNQQAFQRAAVTLRHHYGMISPHARVTLGLLHDINTAIVPPAGTDPATIDSAYAPEWDFTLQQLEPVVGEESAAPSSPAPSPAPTPSAPTPRYHPRFWKKP